MPLDDSISPGQAGHITDHEVIARRMNNVLFLDDFGALGDGTTSDQTAIQSCLDAVPSSGGIVLGRAGATYRADGLVPKQGTTLATWAGNSGDLDNGVFAWTIKARTSPVGTYVVDATARGVCLDGVNISGNVLCGGVRLRGNGSAFRRGHISQTSIAALYIDAIACSASDVYINNANVAGPGSRTGAVVLVGSDHRITNVEAAGSPGFPGSLYDATLLRNSFYITATNCTLVGCIGQLGDSGYYVTGSLNSFIGCRADFNHGHGFAITGSHNQFVACKVNDCSNGQNNLYDGFNITGQNNTLATCVTQASGTYGLLRYGVKDTASGALVTQHNQYVCMGISGYSTAPYNFAGFAASGPVLSPITVESNSATPDVGGASIVICTHGSATTITNFANGTPGQTIRLYGNSNVTVQHNGSTITTRTGANRALSTQIYRYTLLNNGLWVEDAD